ncbi:hypothetical protein BDW22DRAFT_1483801 [Trametopsis cervina]|nr:hypothetical protein BDW22DRAFT_1483801 [Trametopsis cervina]
MSSLLNKIKPSSHKNEDKGEQEQQFSIQPHPAKTNDPQDLQPPQEGGGLNSNHAYQTFQAPGPMIPNQQQLNSLGKPAGRDELSARSAELNGQ